MCELAEELLNEIKLKEILFVKNIFSKKDPKRHAEEILCDNIQNQTQPMTLKRIYIYIYIYIYMAQNGLALPVTVECKWKKKKDILKFVSVKTMGNSGNML